MQAVDVVCQGLAVVEGLGEGKGKVGLRALVDNVERAVLGKGQTRGAGDLLYGLVFQQMLLI